MMRGINTIGTTFMAILTSLKAQPAIRPKNKIYYLPIELVQRDNKIAIRR